MHLPSSPKKFSRLTSPSILGIWIAPGFCSIGEFRIANDVPIALKWSELVPFSDDEHLKASLCTIIKKRWLQGKPVVLTLSTPDVFAVPFVAQGDKAIEDQDILPAGVEWGNIEYALYEEAGRKVLACIRQSDLNARIAFLREVGLIADAVVPAGIHWSRLWEGETEISCTLPPGILRSVYDGGAWQGSVFLPSDTVAADGQSFSFDGAVRSEYRWCGQAQLPILEAILLSRERPDFTLNLHNSAATELRKIEAITGKAISWTGVGMTVMVMTLLVLIGIMALWRVAANGKGELLKRSTESISLMRQENTQLRAKLSSYKSVLAMKSNDAEIMHNVGALATDSIWYAECKIASDSADANVDIVGYSFSESAIANYIVAAEKIPGVHKAALEFTERLPLEMVEKMTGGRLKCDLYRFKAVLDFSAAEQKRQDGSSDLP